MSKSEDKKDAALARRAQEGDLAAEEELLRKYKGLPRKKAKMYFMIGADEDDVIQEGMIGLFKAIRKYDENKDASFSTFAGHCITNQIISAIRAASRKKHHILNNSLSLEDFLSHASGGPGGSDIRLEDTLAADPAEDPEQMLVIRDVANCIIHNNDGTLSDYEMDVLKELLRGKERGDIAKNLGRTEKSIDNCLQRIRKKIISFVVS